ncbi:hypothetical protein BDW62DRAFT_185107 [Aspergillus aurantiobrunneus]
MRFAHSFSGPTCPSPCPALRVACTDRPQWHSSPGLDHRSQPDLRHFLRLAALHWLDQGLVKSPTDWLEVEGVVGFLFVVDNAWYRVGEISSDRLLCALCWCFVVSSLLLSSRSLNIYVGWLESSQLSTLGWVEHCEHHTRKQSQMLVLVNSGMDIYLSGS